MDLEKEGKLDNMLNNNEDSINATAYTSGSDEHEGCNIIHNEDFM